MHIPGFQNNSICTFHCKSEIAQCKWQIFANCSSAHYPFSPWADNWTTIWASLEVRCSHVSEFCTTERVRGNHMDDFQTWKIFVQMIPLSISPCTGRRKGEDLEELVPQEGPESMNGCGDMRPPPNPPAFCLQPVLSCSEQELYLVQCHVIGVICQHWLILLMSKLFIKCKAQWK